MVDTGTVTDLSLIGLLHTVRNRMRKRNLFALNEIFFSIFGIIDDFGRLPLCKGTQIFFHFRAHLSIKSHYLELKLSQQGVTTEFQC